MGLYDKYYVCAFDTKNEAVYLYYILEKEGYNNFQLVSTPCLIQAGCGYSIRFNNIKYLNILIKEAGKVGIPVEKVYLLGRKDGKRTIERIIFNGV